MDDAILKVAPSPEELHIVGHRNQDSCKCPEVGCSYVASNACVLGLHKSQVHNFRTQHKKGTENVHYHCPVSDCYFSLQSERHFKNIDTLRTHYMKLHSEKKFPCKKCNKIFGLERDCYRHEVECGKDFYCLDCHKVYTNRSALRRHCDYNGHHMQAQETRINNVKKSKSKPMKVSNKVKGKPPTVNKSTLPFILPKNMLPKATSSQMHSLHIQTDASGSQFLISKMASDSSTSQGVQTVDRANMTRSAGIQTTLGLLPRNSKVSDKTKRLSTGIQTVLPDFTSLNSLCVAETQTGTSILQNAMTKANIPILNVCKGAQKSSSSHKRKKSNTSCTTGSQTFCSSTMAKRSIDYPDTSQLFLRHAVISTEREAQNRVNGSMDYLMSTMSTQTSLSCVSEQIFPKLYNKESETQLQDCHTQTHRDTIIYGQETPLYLDQNIQARDFVSNSDQITQTKSYYFSIDQNTQTGIMNSSSNKVVFSLQSIQDNQTQTSHDPLNSGVSPNNQTQQPQIARATDTAQVRDQGTTCDELFSLSDGELSNFSKEEMSLDNDAEIYFPQEDKNENVVKCLRTSGSANDLTDLLMEVINSDMPCGDDVCSLNAEEYKNVKQNTSIELDLCGHCENREDTKLYLPVASMETQTFGNWGMDSMTQTIEDLSWDMSTQTVDYYLTDMMTQTGDDFLEFLTNDTHTQTLDDFCMNLVSDDCSRTCGCAGTSTLDNVSPTSLQGLFGDHVSTQTIWDKEDQTLDFYSSSFAASADTSFVNPSQESDIQSQLFLDKEQNANTVFTSYAETFVSNIAEKWENVPTSETQMIFSDFSRDTETAETQTMFDPLFYCLTSEDTFHSRRQVKYLESSHTQTTQDPILPSIASDDDHVPFFIQSVFAQKETSETQTGTDYNFSVGRETAECQTPWENYLTSVGTSETQTQNTDIFGVTCSNTQTQTFLESELLANLDMTN